MLAGGAVALVLLVVVWSLLDLGGSGSYVVGRMFLPVALSVLGVALVVRQTGWRCPGWLAAGLVVGTSTFLAAFSSIGTIVDELEADHGDPTASSDDLGDDGLVDDGRMLITPGRVGDLALDTGPAARDRERERLAQLAADPLLGGEVERVEYAEYRGPDGSAVLFTGVDVPADYVEEMDAEGELPGLLVSAGDADRVAVEPGPLGGAMTCQESVAVAPDTFACAWADAGTLGLLYLTTPAGTLDEAAVLARDVRETVTQRP